MSDLVMASQEERNRAQLEVDRFVRRFDEAYRLIACHCALPLVLTPELVHALRRHFLRGQVPPMAEADLLLSGLCRQVGYETYVMDAAVRAVLLEEMAERLGRERQREVARLLIDFSRQRHRGEGRRSWAEMRSQQWAAMLYLGEEEQGAAVGEIEDALSTARGHGDRAEMSRLAELARTLMPELEGHLELVMAAEEIRELLQTQHSNGTSLDFQMSPSLTQRNPRISDGQGQSPRAILKRPEKVEKFLPKPPNSKSDAYDSAITLLDFVHIVSPHEIYFAAVGDTQRKLRAQIVNELEGQQIQVREEVPPPYASADHRQAVTEIMMQVRLSVHLLDDLPGTPALDGDRESYPVVQLRLALELERSYFIWLPRRIDLKAVEDVDYRNFLEDLESREKLHRGPANELATDIACFLQRICREEKASTVVPPSVLIDAQQRDQEYVIGIGQALLKSGIVPYIAPTPENSRSIRTLLREALSKATAVIVIQGHADEMWVLFRLKLLLEIALADRLDIVLCVYLAPPAKVDRDLNKSLPFKVHIVDNREGFDSGIPLLGEL